MPNQLPSDLRVPGQDVDPINSRHDMVTTNETIKQMLSGGTPDWVSHPEDYKEFVREAFAEEREISRDQVIGYQMEDQDILTDSKPRMVNVIDSRIFIEKLRTNGVRCFTIDNAGLNPYVARGTVALWAFGKNEAEAKYICFMQIPAMYEWSVLRLDEHGLGNGEDYRGWRTVLYRLIEEEILTEQQAHQIFGKPSLTRISRRYRRSLWELRNGVGRKQYQKTIQAAQR